MRLIDAPVGLFIFNGKLCLKTEYYTNGRVDAYIVSSGEMFWGGAKTTDELNSLEVMPVMTPEQFRDRMKDFYHEWLEVKYDNEMGHVFMDALMIGVLRQLGYGEGVDICDNAKKWYG